MPGGGSATGTKAAFDRTPGGPVTVPLAANEDEQIRACLARYAAGVECSTELGRLRQAHPVRFQTLLEEVRSSVKGSAFQRLSALAPAATGEAKAAMRQGARRPASVGEARAFLRSGVREGAEAVLEWVVRQPPAVRAALAGDLRPHALYLRERALPAILAAGETREVKAVLELLEAWQKALPLREALPLVRHADPEIRSRAFRVLHYVAPAREAAPEVLRALAEEHAEVRRAACVAAARLRLVEALPSLAALLRSHDPRLGEAAARGLVEMGLRGLEVLRVELASAWRPKAAAAALEALEELKTSGYGYGRL